MAVQCTKGWEVTSKHRISHVLEDLKLGPNESFWFLALLGNNVGYFIGKCFAESLPISLVFKVLKLIDI